MEYYHVDVFSDTILSGNGLTVVISDVELDEALMQDLTREFKQFETIFLRRIDENVFQARIFTVDEELDFAGHPILGAAAVIHKHYFDDKQEQAISFQLKNKKVITYSKKETSFYDVQMNQGKPEFIGEVSENKKGQYAQALNLTLEHLSDQLPMEVVSTGLPYLLVPICSGLEQVKISCSNFEELLAEVSAKFVYVFDEKQLEARTWDNCGNVEDVATGSAAGPLGAYLYKHNVFDTNEPVIIQQGRFIHRPSKIKVTKSVSSGEILVAGSVAILAKGTLFA